MGAFLVGNKKVILPEYTNEFKNQYWSILTAHVLEKIGEEEITSPKIVTEILKECFTIFCAEFEKAIAEISEAAFFLFCNDIHEDSIDIWIEQSKGNKFPFDEEQFAVSRRILKIILEQGCKLELKGHPNFVKEVNEKQKVYIKHLEKILYIGSWCIALSEEVSNSQLFPKSKGIQISDNTLNILTYQPYPELFKFIHQDLSRHNTNIVLSDSMIEFKQLLNDEIGVDYDVLASFINQKMIYTNYNYSITKIEPLINGIHEELSYDKEFLCDFYGGLTVSSRNVLSVEDCILKNQHSNRFMYRPILEYTIDGEKYNIIGYNKWAESFTVLSTNCFPFGHYPEEWKKYETIKKFVLKVTDEHDSILEKPIINFLEEEGIMVDGNIKSFKTKNGNNIPIEIPGVGQIDLIFIDEKHKVLYLGECKHNRSRFDMNNWKRDYSNFVEKYESQLANKEKWVQDNISVVKEHFEILYNRSIDFREYIVRAVFFINAPTIYMFNGNYRTFTFTDLKNLITGKPIDTIFQFKNNDTKQVFEIKHPYFKNLHETLEHNSSIPIRKVKHNKHLGF